jgi:hypothetical protein
MHTLVGVPPMMEVMKKFETLKKSNEEKNENLGVGPCTDLLS